MKILFLSQVSECKAPVKPRKRIIYTKIKKWDMRRYYFSFELCVSFFSVNFANYSCDTRQWKTEVTVQGCPEN